MREAKMICAYCKLSIRKHHRWHFVHHEWKIFGIVIRQWTTREHRNCLTPMAGTTNPYVKRGEQPLPFVTEPTEFKTTGVHEAKYPFTFDLESTAKGRKDYPEIPLP